MTLRELTDAAHANVAAVSYHFGSLKSLCDAAIEYALERYLDAQQEAVSALGAEASLEALAAAFARPMMRALAVGGRDLDVMRIVARAGIDPPAGMGSVRCQLRSDSCRCPSGAEGQRSRCQGPGADLPHALRGRIVELAGPRAGRGRAQEQVREADRATAGTRTRRCLPRHEHRLTSGRPATVEPPASRVPNNSSNCLTRIPARGYSQSSD